MDSLPYTPTTLLEAVNELLGTIGESEISTLIGRLPRDAERALRYLHAASRAIQSKGWSFNTDYGFTLVRNGSNEIPIPNDALEITFEPGSGLTTREGKVYNNTTHTFVQEADATADVVRFLPFESLPERARQAIFIRAGLSFQAQSLVEDLLFRFSDIQLEKAMGELENDHVDDTSPNAITDSPDVQRILRARR